MIIYHELMLALSYINDPFPCLAKTLTKIINVNFLSLFCVVTQLGYTAIVIVLRTLPAVGI